MVKMTSEMGTPALVKTTVDRVALLAVVQVVVMLLREAQAAEMAAARHPVAALRIAAADGPVWTLVSTVCV